MDTHTFFYNALIYLAAAVISVPVAKRLGMGSVLGYLIAGVIIGPFGLGLIHDEHGAVMHFAEFGVVMMLFLIGLELQPKRLWEMRTPILGLGGLQVLLTTAAFAATGMSLGLSWRVALAIALALVLSSTAIVLQTLQEKSLIKTQLGQSSFSVLLFQDIAVIPILALLPLLALPPESTPHELTPPPAIHQNVSDAHSSHPPAHHHEEGHEPTRSQGQQSLLMVVAVAGIVICGRFLMRHVFIWIANTELRELFTATALLLIVAITLIMQKVGLSPALGAFLAGVVLADSEYRHELEGDIEPFKGLLLGLFFLSVGTGINFKLLAENPENIALLVTGLVLIKFAVLWFLSRLFKMAKANQLLFSFILAQGSEFAFVILAFSQQQGVISDALSSTMVAVVALSMLTTPLLLIFHDKVIQPRFYKAPEADEHDDMQDHEHPVLIAGYGRFGQITGRLLQAKGFRTTILELDPGQIEMLRRFHHKVYYGNAARLELLHAAGAASARILILAIDDREASLQLVREIHREFPHLKILARAHDRIHAYELRKAGADFIRRETFDSAVMLGARALEELGVHPHEAHRSAQTFIQHDEKAMDDNYELWDDQKAYILETRRQFNELSQVLEADQSHNTLPPDGAWDNRKLKEEGV